VSDSVKVFKLYWLDQDQEQEVWLREMALRGLHLKHISWTGHYTFTLGAPADVVYRIDASSSAGKADYRQLVDEAGWELVSNMLGWHYWRHNADGARPLEIFSESESKIKQYKALMVCSFIIAISQIPLLTVRNGLVVLSVLQALGFFVTGYQAMRLRKRIAQLKRGAI